MSLINQIIESFKDEGIRITKVRKKMLDIFDKNRTPLSAPEILERLEKSKLSVNKTTVYRELEFLMSKKVVQEIDLLDGLKRYEFSDSEGSHHHHLVCSSCKKILCVDMHNDLDSIEKQLNRLYGFKIHSHVLEFFGTCMKCHRDR